MESRRDATTKMLPQEKPRFTQLVRAMRGLIDERTTPKDIIQAALLLWHKAACPDLQVPSLQMSANLKHAVEVQAFAHWLGEQELITGAFWLSSAYAALVEKDVRKRKAMYFTPPYLSGLVLNNAGPRLLGGKIVDPACGGAAFLAPAALRIAERLDARGHSSSAIIEHIENHLYGCDSDEFLCLLATALVRMVLARHIARSGREPKLRIRVDDGLVAFAPEVGSFDLVLCNPPYRKMTAEECADYRHAYSDVIVGQPNLYSMFIRRATQLLKIRGRAVMLTPMSFLSGQSFSRVREALSRLGTVGQFDLIHAKDGVFLEAEQDAVVTTWEKAKRQRSTKVFNLHVTGKPEFAGACQISPSKGPWPIPRLRGDEELLPLFTKELPRLLDYGYTSKTGAIVIHRDKRETFAKLSDCRRAGFAVPLLWQGDIESNGKLRLAESADHPHRYVDVGSVDSPAVVKAPCLAYQRVTSADQPRRLVCAVVPQQIFEQFGGVVGENHVGFLARAAGRTDVSPKLLSNILRTTTVDRLFRCISGVTNVSAYEIDSLPMPELRKVKAALTSGYLIEDAVRVGYGLKVAKLNNCEQKAKVREAKDGRRRSNDSRSAA